MADTEAPDGEGYLYGYTEQAKDCGEAFAVLAEECAIALSYNGLSQAVMMVTPSSLDDFVVGFSLTSGLIQSMDEIYDVQITRSGGCATGTPGMSYKAEVEVSSRAFSRLKEYRRRQAGTSGCGLCGVEALEQALPHLQPLQAGKPPTPAQLLRLRERITGVQELARESGALHAALYLDHNGEILACREDIGRHNALDKLIGAIQRQHMQSEEGFAVVTSRCSLELIQKAVRARISSLVCLSAPTRLSVDWARAHGLNLLHIPRHSPPRLYSPAPAIRV